MVKAPWPNFHADAPVRQNPDAVIVICHRDPAMAIPSAAIVVNQTHREIKPVNAARGEVYFHPPAGQRN